MGATGNIGLSFSKFRAATKIIATKVEFHFFGVFAIFVFSGRAGRRVSSNLPSLMAHFISSFHVLLMVTMAIIMDGGMGIVFAQFFLQFFFELFQGSKRKNLSSLIQQDFPDKFVIGYFRGLKGFLPGKEKGGRRSSPKPFVNFHGLRSPSAGKKLHQAGHYSKGLLVVSWPGIKGARN